MPTIDHVCEGSEIHHFARQINGDINWILCQVEARISDWLAQQMRRDVGLTCMQASLLMMLSLRRGQTASQLVGQYGMESSAVSRALDRMYGMGLVNRTRDETDRRVVNVELTDKGSLLVPRVRRIMSQADERLQDCLMPEEIGFLKIMLRKIVANCC